TTNGATATTRYAKSIAGDLAATITTTTGGANTLALPVVDLHGDTVTTIDVPTTGNCTGIGEWTDTDEYGNPLNTDTGTTPTTSTGIGYGWLGGKQRATTNTGMLLMGVRLYNPSTGQFTSPDPVFGGNSTAYAYPQDPINGYDITGQWGCGWCSKVIHAVVHHVKRHWKSDLGYAAAGACIFATGGVCTGLTVVVVGISAWDNTSAVIHHRKRWYQAAGSFAFDAVGLRIRPLRAAFRPLHRVARGLHAFGPRRWRSIRYSLRHHRVRSAVSAGYNAMAIWKTHRRW
ncbi:MAG TPA: RHS repeat-associated core domain-containing protein, partial [Mycobacteriales bacterium]|nr:RHS repeat-associated core domain-containing protein [Mycobacteriales bacterium]